MDKIAVITYNVPHKKTQDVLFQLKIYGYRNVKVYATPFVKRKPFQPIFQHRPTNKINIPPEQFCKCFLFDFQEIRVNNLNLQFKNDNPDYILIAGAGLLPDELINNHKIINSHPGWLPKVRGLDSLKWAIHQKKKLGVTAHIINSVADAGQLIEQIKVPVYKNDTFHSVAFRQYEMEIDLLVKSIKILKEKSELKVLNETESEPTRRMPKEIEKNLLIEFEEYKNIFKE